MLIRHVMSVIIQDYGHGTSVRSYNLMANVNAWYVSNIVLSMSNALKSVELGGRFRLTTYHCSENMQHVMFEAGLEVVLNHASFTLHRFGSTLLLFRMISPLSSFLLRTFTLGC